MLGETRRRAALSLGVDLDGDRGDAGELLGDGLGVGDEGASCFTTRRLASSNSLCIEGVGMLASLRGKR